MRAVVHSLQSTEAQRPEAARTRDGGSDRETAVQWVVGCSSPARSMEKSSPWPRSPQPLPSQGHRAWETTNDWVRGHRSSAREMANRGGTPLLSR